MAPHNIERAFSSLAELGYRPSVPVTSTQFADAATRESWIRDKGMKVLQLWSDDHPETPIDIFVKEPFPFDEEYDRALIKPLYSETEVRFVSLETLVKLKEDVGRAQDKADIEQLKMRLKNGDD